MCSGILDTNVAKNLLYNDQLNKHITDKFHLCFKSYLKYSDVLNTGQFLLNWPNPTVKTVLSLLNQFN